jgi:hypothetical protein
MAETSLVCAILRVLVTNHAYGRPLPEDVVLSRASYPPHEGGAAKEAYERVQSLSFVLDHGDRGIMLDNSAFSALVQFLSDTCNWERFELELRVKHFEGWDEIDWSE